MKAAPATTTEPRSAIDIVDDIGRALNEQSHVLRMLSAMATLAVDSSMGKDFGHMLWPGIATTADDIHERTERVRGLVDELWEHVRVNKKDGAQ